MAEDRPDTKKNFEQEAKKTPPEAIAVGGEVYFADTPQETIDYINNGLRYYVPYVDY